MWGAQGGDLNSFKGGLGGYCKANFNLSGTYYIHVGLNGNYSLSATESKSTPLYGGGGVSGEYNKYGMHGGGATDIRTSSVSNWQDENGLKTRFIVAGGGGGANNRQYGYNSGNGGYGGGLTAGTGTSVPSPPATIVTSKYSILTGGTQTSGGTNTYYDADGTFICNYTGSYGQFGYAMAIPPPDPNTTSQHTQSGGGGGWYGGAGGYHCGGGGGSSFISGHTGCIAIAQTPLTCINGTSVMIDGGGHEWKTTSRGGSKVMPKPTGGTETGHTGNGYCIITWHPAL